MALPAKAQAPGTAENGVTQSLASQFASALMTVASAYEAPLAQPEEELPIVSDAYILPPVFIAIPPRKLNLDIPYSRVTYCSCVNYAKAVLGVTGTWGNAKDIKPTTQLPKIGSVIITRDGGGHVGVVTETASSSVTIVEANFDSCASSSRTVPLNYPNLVGFRDY